MNCRSQRYIDIPLAGISEEEIQEIIQEASEHTTVSGFNFIVDTTSNLATYSGTRGNFFYASDTGILYISDGSLWRVPTSSHSSLLNLSNDDHTQYYLADGSRELTGDLLPDMTGASGTVSTVNIGSSAKKIQNIYVHDLFLDSSSLYVNEKKIIEDTSPELIFKTDPNQDLSVKTYGVADINLVSNQADVNVVAYDTFSIVAETVEAWANLRVMGKVSVTDGYQISNTGSPVGSYLRSNGTYFVASGIQTSDLPADVVTSSVLLTTSGTIINQIPSLSGYATQNWVISQNYVNSDTLVSTSGIIIAQIPSLSGYATESWANNSFVPYSVLTTTSGDIIAQMSVGDVTLEQLLTTSGNIVSQIPSLSGYATQTWVTDQGYVTTVDLSTTSGNIVAQIPSMDGYATQSWTNSNFIDNAEMSSISGSLVNQITSSSGIAAGSDTQIQFNDYGQTSGSNNLVWDKTNDVLGISGKLKCPIILPPSDSTSAFQLQTATGSGIITIDTTNRRATLSGNVVSSSVAQFVINNTDTTDYSWNKELECQRNGIAGFSVQTRYHNNGFQYTALTIGSSSSLYIFGNGDKGTGGSLVLQANTISFIGGTYPNGILRMPRTGDATSVATQRSSYPLSFQCSLWDSVLGASAWYNTTLTNRASTVSSLVTRFSIDITGANGTVEAVTIENTVGNVGVNVATPAARLHIYDSNAGASNPTLYIQQDHASNTGTLLKGVQDGTGDLIHLLNGSDTRFKVDYQGNTMASGVTTDALKANSTFGLGVTPVSPRPAITLPTGGSIRDDELRATVSGIAQALRDFGLILT